MPFIYIADVEIIASYIEIVVKDDVMHFSYIERIPGRPVHISVILHRSLERTSPVGHIVVADDISVVETRLCHNFIILRVNAMIPSHDIAQTDTECVVSVHFLYEPSHIFCLFLKIGKFASFADLRVGDYDYVVICVILGVFLHDEVIPFYIFLQFLVKKGSPFEGRGNISGWCGDEYEPAVLVGIHPETTLGVCLYGVQTVGNHYSGDSFPFRVLYCSLDVPGIQ